MKVRISVFVASLLLLSGISSAAYAQSLTTVAFNSTGFSFNDKGYSIDSNIGEAVISTITTSNSVITQGLLQPEILDPCQVATLMFYPNPTQDELFVSAENCELPIERVSVFDMKGVEVAVQSLESGKVNLQELSSGIYIVRSYFKDDEVAGTFKISKISN